MDSSLLISEPLEIVSKDLGRIKESQKQLRHEVDRLILENQRLQKELSLAVERQLSSVRTFNFGDRNNSVISDKRSDVWRDATKINDAQSDLLKKSMQEIERLTDELMAERRKYMPVDGQLKDLKSTYEASMHRLSKSSEDAAAQVKHLQNGGEVLRQKLAIEAEKTRSLEQQLQAKLGLLNSLQSELSRLQVSENDRRALEAENQKLSQLCAELAASKQALEQKLQEFVQKLHDAFEISELAVAERNKMLQLTAEEHEKQKLEVETMLQQILNKTTKQKHELQLVHDLEIQKLLVELESLQQKYRSLSREELYGSDNERRPSRKNRSDESKTVQTDDSGPLVSRDDFSNLRLQLKLADENFEKQRGQLNLLNAGQTAKITQLTADMAESEKAYRNCREQLQAALANAQQKDQELKQKATALAQLAKELSMEKETGERKLSQLSMHQQQLVLSLESALNKQECLTARWRQEAENLIKSYRAKRKPKHSSYARRHEFQDDGIDD